MLKVFYNIARCLVLALLLLMQSSGVFAQVANFVPDDTAGCAPMVVNFTNSSTGATSYSWNLGNSTTTSITHPSATYTSAGTYTVTLTAINGASSNTISKIIRVYALPTVSFTAADTSLCLFEPAVFTNTSVSNAWGPMTYSWNFGDGYTSTLVNPSHTYSATGSYNVNLFATSAPGCTNSLSRSGYVRVYARPVATFAATGATTFCTPPSSVAFSNSSTGYGSLAYLWRLGDGTTATGSTTSKTYSLAGGYTVSLIVTDGRGCKDSMVRPSYVNVGNLNANFTAPSGACNGSSVAFTNTSSSHVARTWAFGDGGTSNDENPAHSYFSSGTYSVRLIVFDGACFDTVVRSISISPSPAATFTISPANPCAPPVTLSYNATIPAGCTARWLFGDTVTRVGTSVSRSFSLPVIDWVDLFVTNSTGCTSKFRKIDTLFNLLHNPVASPNVGCAPLTVNFTSDALSRVYDAVNGLYTFYSDPPYYIYSSYPHAVTSHLWNFGDGSPTSTSTTPVHTYTAVGTYSVSCTITTVNGCSKTTVIPVNVGLPPVATFSITPTRVCGKKTFYYTCTTPGPIERYMWNFGDGISAEMTGPPTVSHVYNIPGFFVVSLSIRKGGCVGPASTMADTVDSPIAVMRPSYTCTPGNVVNFSDLSFGATSRTWLFGDGTTSTLPNPAHTYSALTTFTATLTTHNSRSGCRDTTQTSIILAKPIVRISTRDSTICRDQIDTFYNTVAGGTAVRFRWYVNWVLVDSLNPRFIYTYRTRGTHTIHLVIQDTHGCFDTSNGHSLLVAKPIARFIHPDTICAPAMVNFLDVSTDVPGANIIAHEWTFGDASGGFDTVPAMSHAYPAANLYWVTEMVTDDVGCMDTFKKFVPVLRPVAAGSISATDVCPDVPINFSNTSVGIAGFRWLFGDGNTSLLASPSHSYSVVGSYISRLIVVDTSGCGDSLVTPITVHPSPVAAFNMSDSFAVCPPFSIVYSNSSTGATSYYWDFGDGTSSIAPTPTSVFLYAGSYTIRLAAINSFGCSDTASRRASIFGYGGAFTYTPDSGCSPLPISFRTTRPSTTIAVWDFNDGYVSPPLLRDTVSHVYRRPGSYLPKLILTDPSSGCSNFSLGVDTIRIDTIMPGFTTALPALCTYAPINFVDTSRSLFSTTSSWFWSFGGLGTSTLRNPSFTFTAPGTYAITLSVANSNGCTSTIIRNITVNAGPSPIIGSSGVCVADTTRLSSSTSGGIWSTSTSGSVATLGVLSGIVYGVGTGVAIISYTLPTGCRATTTVAVNPIPGPIMGSSSVCATQSTTLSNATLGGSWSTFSSSIATVDSVTGVVTGLATGNGRITYSFTGGCRTTTTINVLALANIAGVTGICAGRSTTLSNIVGGGTWASSNTAVALVLGLSSGTSTVAGMGFGTSLITYTLPSGCATTTTITVNDVPPAISGPTAVCMGTISTYSLASSGGVWSSSAPAVASIHTGTGALEALYPGTAIITYSLGTGCLTAATVTVHPVPAPVTGSSSVCVGFVTNFSSFTPGGSWVSSAATIASVHATSGIVRGITPGSSLISYVLPITGCFASRSITVLPTPTPILGNTGVCHGLLTTLSNTSAGGAWISPGAGGVLSIGFTSGVVNGILPGTAIVSYAFPTGCAAAVTVTVHPLPSAITGLGIVCSGLFTTFFNADAGGTWSSGNLSIATADAATGDIGGVSPGSAAITYTLPTGCIATTSVLVISSPPPISGINQLCDGATTTLSNPSAGGTWVSSDVFVATIDVSSGHLVGVAPGTALISYMQYGCPAVVSFTVHPLPLPILGNTITCVGLPNTLSSAPSGGLWSIGSASSSFATIGSASGEITGIFPGTATVTYTLPTGCTAASTQTVNPIPPSITGLPDVCLGFSRLLRNSAAGGTWSSSMPTVASIGSSGFVNGLSVGTSIISYVRDGCPATFPFTVYPLPRSVSVTGPICAWGGSTFAYCADTPAGSWSSSLVTVSAAGVVVAAAPGIGVVTYTLPTGCVATATLMVTPLPSPIFGPTYVCIGGTGTLSSATPGGTWSAASAAGIATVGSTSGVLYGIAHGGAAITYTLPSGCQTTYNITVDPRVQAVSGDSAMCQGSTITVSGMPSGGRWSTGAGFVASVGSSSGIVTGVAGGTAMLTYTLATLCRTTSMQHSVTVLPLPDAGAIAGPAAFCSGATITLSASAAGGVWRVVGGHTSIVPMGTLCTVTGALVGSDTVYYTATNGCGNVSSQHEVAVQALPFAGSISGPSVLCPGSTGTMSATFPGGNWATTNSTVSLSADTVTAVASGTASITYTISNACGAAQAVHTLEILPLTIAAILQGDSTICVGATTTISADQPGGTWTATGGGIVATDGVVQATTTGRVTINYTVTGPCGNATTQHTLEVLPLPVAASISGRDSLCAGDSALYTTNNTNGTWTIKGPNALINPDGLLKAVSPGGDTVFYAVTNSCGTAYAAFPMRVRSDSGCIDSAIVRIPTVGCSGDGDIAIYPNPNPGTFSMQVFTPRREVVELIITDMLGRKAAIMNGYTNEQLEVKLYLAAGTYVVSAFTSNGVCTVKMDIMSK